MASPPQKLVPGLPEGRMIGYVRVSREEQSEKMQVDALVAAGVDPKSIYVDKASGRTLNRRGVTAALKAARGSDVFVVWRLDRLSRSTRDVAGLIEDFRERGISLYSITEGIDITTPGGKAMVLMQAVMAEYEVEVMSERTKAGQQAGRELGYFPGRPSKTNDEQKAEIAKLMANKPKKHTAVAWRDIVAKRFKISTGSVVNIVKNARRDQTRERRESAVAKILKKGKADG